MSGQKDAKFIDAEKSIKLTDAFVTGLTKDLEDSDRRNASNMEVARKFLNDNNIKVSNKKIGKVVGSLTAESPYDVEEVG